jgi:dolichyl-diphosphooligosaccharide--protein glycosyltransferase
MANATSKPSSSAASALFGWVWFGAIIYVIGVVSYNAYEIRMGAINEFGPVIHEFDPYFNYRATEVSDLVICGPFYSLAFSSRIFLI